MVNSNNNSNFFLSLDHMMHTARYFYFDPFLKSS
jgi:hypothetical protein